MTVGSDGILPEARWLLDIGLLPNSNSATRAIGYRQVYLSYLVLLNFVLFPKLYNSLQTMVAFSLSIPESFIHFSIYYFFFVHWRPLVPLGDTLGVLVLGVSSYLPMSQRVERAQITLIQLM